MVIEQDQPKSQLSVSLHKIFSWSFLSGLSLSAGLFIFLWLPKNSTGQWVGAIFLYILIAGAILVGVHRLIYLFIPARLNSLSPVWRVGMISVFLLAGIWLSLNLFFTIPPPEVNPFASPYLVKLAYRGSVGIALGLSLLFLGVWIGTTLPSREGTHQKSLLRAAIKYALLCVIVWGVYLLAFFPGMMSYDSMDQWGQVLAGRFVDHHPAFHTFLIWLLTRISLTPTVVAIAQILSLALVAGLWFAFFETLGIHRWVIVVGAVIFALTPVNGTMVNTLWKDIPYGTAVLGLSLIIARLVVTRGAWINTLTAQITLGVTAALVMLLRHDGASLGAATLLVLVVVFPKMWKGWLVTIAVCAFLYLGIRGPLYRWVGVEQPASYTSDSLSLYSISAYAIAGSQTDELVDSIRLTSPDWNCSIWTEITPEMLQADLDQSIPMRDTLVNLLGRAPNLLSYYTRCARTMEWVVWDPNGEVRNASHVQSLVDPNPYGLRFDSKIPALEKFIADWVIETSHDPNQNWLIWRPAIFMYLHLFLSAVLIIRNRDWRYGLLSLPILIQSISFSLILAEPNFRYHYAVYLVALISLPLFFSPPREEKFGASGEVESQPELLN